MAKNYRIEKEPRFGFDRVIVGPGVYEVIAPEAVAGLKELGVLDALENAYKAGESNGSYHARQKGLRCMGAMVKAVSVAKKSVTLVDVKSTRDRLSAVCERHGYRLNVPGIQEATTTVPTASREGTHGAGSGKTN